MEYATIEAFVGNSPLAIVCDRGDRYLSTDVFSV